ncbi:MAG TPA: helicase-related protein, partial [Ktedonobacteraceae bacterium]|nr:helicase-related protein [Ktedonobacteraceae bacterium]
DFRPHYCRIVTLLNALPAHLPVLALTATANQRVEQDIRQQIGASALVVRGSMQRANLHLNVTQTHGDAEKLSYLAANVPMWPGSGLVYTGTQRSAEMVAAFLQQQGIEAEYYHAGREDSERQSVEQGLMTNAYKVICSTNALGMGIDKPDIRFVIHYHIPASPIHYYQEIGRAGRDGKSARCVLLYDPEDLAIQQHFINGAKPSIDQYEAVLVLVRNEAQGWRFNDLMRITGLPRNVLQNILIDLEEQGFIQRLKLGGSALYASHRLGRVDASFYEHIQQVRTQKEQELADIQNYAEQSRCSMGYLTAYLGDVVEQICGTCGNCGPQYWSKLPVSSQLEKAVTYFIERIFLPRLAKRGSINRPEHEAGWALSDHGSTRIGKLVRASKYEGAGPFPDELIVRAVEVVRTRYPIGELGGITSVPPTKSGSLVEDFARRVAKVLGLRYVSVLVKQRVTQEQKICTNVVQKKENVKGAFSVQKPEQIVGQSLLVIDDIYDSGYTLREVATTLRKAGAKAVYPLTITKTMHSDDQ